LYSLPHATKSTFQPWDPSSSSTIDTLREVALDSAWWEKLVSYYSEENHETTIIQDNVSCIKSICESSIFPSYIVFTYRIPVQILEDEPLEVFKPHVEKLIADKDQNKQRAAAELLAAVLNGKNWPSRSQTNY
jgi:proteasome activator subunit 4